MSAKLLILFGVCCLCFLSKAEREWWKDTIVYQIYPRSFQDSDGDGVGDLKGIQSRLDYFKDLGVDTLWLSPIYRSPFKDFGYDISDHKDIDPVFGTLEDFDSLLNGMHKNGMKLIMDYIPNHTSDLHEWFQESRKGKDNKYSDYYIWTDGQVLEDGTKAPPNNWISIFGGSAWEWDDLRGQYYYHQFIKEQPDLNYRNPEVVEQMEDVVRFWIDRGVDGFRVDAIGTMFEVEDLTLDEPPSGKPGLTPEEHSYWDHKYTMDLEEIHDVVRGWRDVMDEAQKKSGVRPYMVMEIYDETLVHTMKYYHSGADMPFNFILTYTNNSCGGSCIKELVDQWMRNMPEGGWPNFVLGNHDQKRVTTKKGPHMANAMNIMLLTLPGTPTTYYGEEIGMLDIQVSYEDTQDPFGINLGQELYEKYSRDPCRSPMQWDAGKNAGFSTADKTWLPVHSDYRSHNVEAQKTDSAQTTLKIYAAAAQMRRLAAFRNSEITYSVVNDNIFSYIRREGSSVYLVALNLGSERSSDDYTTEVQGENYQSGSVMLNTGNFVRGEYRIGSRISIDSLKLEPGQGLVIKLATRDGAKDEL